jgi:predicted DCC family thiol-disulfide oxidoreductase YuxK
VNETRPLVVFDGVCNLCVGSVKFILAHEASDSLQFASIQSPHGSRLVRELGFDPADAKTFVFVEDGVAFVRSDAALRLARHLRWPWRGLTAFRVIPRPLRNWVYNLVAANRYRWFGRAEACMVPTPALKRRFVEE